MKDLILGTLSILFGLTPAAGQLSLMSQNIEIEIGDTIDAAIKVSGFNDMVSFQFSVGWDIESLEYIGTGDYFTQSLAGSFNTTKLEEGKIGALWFDTSADGVSLEDNTTLFSIKFVGIADSEEGATIAFVDEPLDAEFTDTSLAPLPDTLLSFEEGSMMVGSSVSITPFFKGNQEKFNLYPNQPNPFWSITRIIFDLYTQEKVILEVYDVLGRNIHSINTDLSAGRNNFALRREIFPKAGIYYYSIRVGTQQMSRSILLLE